MGKIIRGQGATLIINGEPVGHARGEFLDYSDEDGPGEHRRVQLPTLEFSVDMSTDPVAYHRAMLALGFKMLMRCEGWRSRLFADVARRDPGAVRRSIRKAYQGGIVAAWEYYDR